MQQQNQNKTQTIWKAEVLLLYFHDFEFVVTCSRYDLVCLMYFWVCCCVCGFAVVFNVMILDLLLVLLSYFGVVVMSLYLLYGFWSCSCVFWFCCHIFGVAMVFLDLLYGFRFCSCFVVVFFGFLVILLVLWCFCFLVFLVSQSYLWCL